jgi:signal transduction histidine kinase
MRLDPAMVRRTLFVVFASFLASGVSIYVPSLQASEPIESASGPSGGFDIVFLFGLTMGLVAYAAWRAGRRWQRRSDAEQAVRAANADTGRKVEERARQLLAAQGDLNAREDRLRLVSDFGIAHLPMTRSTWSADTSRVRDDLLATVSHELRTPLNAIVGWTEILKIDRGENRTRAIEAIERSAFVQMRLIDDLLAASKLSDGQLVLNMTPIDFRATLKGSLLAIRPAASAKGVTIEVTAPEEVPVRGDEARLQQVTWNLLSNAVKFTPPAGHVYIEVVRLDDGARLSVRDTGEGIDPDLLPHVFEPFRHGASRSPRAGLGLGLAIVQQIVALHGGTVVAASDGLKRGSVFTVVLPGCPATAGVAGSLDDRPLNLRILIVEDDADAAITLSTLLAHRGCQVEVAHTAQECLRMFYVHIPDVLLCDIGLPDGDGYSLLREIRRQVPGRRVPAIALSAYARDDDRALAVDAGFSAYVTKPYEVEQLMSHVRHAALAH